MNLLQAQSVTRDNKNTISLTTIALLNDKHACAGLGNSPLILEWVQVWSDQVLDYSQHHSQVLEKFRKFQKRNDGPQEEIVVLSSVGELSWQGG